MSGTIGASTYGTLDRMLTSASSLRDQYATLQEQTTTGLISQSYSGIASNSSRVLSLSALSSQQTAYQQSITQAQGKATVMQTALSQIGTLVSTLSASALSATTSSSPSAITSMAQQASQALSQLEAALNTSYEGDYVFSGADTSNPPVPATIAGSAMYSQIGTAVGQLATTSGTPSIAATVIATTVTATTAASGAASVATTPPTNIFSNYLSLAGANAAITVQIGPSQSVSLGLPANQIGAPSATGTGNAISDVIRSLAVMANSTSAMASNPDFTTLMQNAATTLTSAGTTLSQESGQIGLSQNTMTAAASSYTSMQTVMASQLSNLTNVDMATVISRMQTVNTQLQSSYQVLGEMSKLNLASYL